MFVYRQSSPSLISHFVLVRIYDTRLIKNLIFINISKALLLTESLFSSNWSTEAFTNNYLLLFIFVMFQYNISSVVGIHVNTFSSKNANETNTGACWLALKHFKLESIFLENF